MNMKSSVWSVILAVVTFIFAAQEPAAANAQDVGRVQSLDSLLKLLDKDGDGKVAKDETTGPYTARFRQWDANGDGFATREEIHNYRLTIGIDDEGRRIANGRGPQPAAIPVSAKILTAPADWRLENLPMPPGFAPEIKLRGSEEIRFAPGMFQTTAGDYFTCVIAIAVSDPAELTAEDLQDFLQKYYLGLSTGLARRSGATVDPAQMKAIVTPAPGESAKSRFDAQIDFFDFFTDGRKTRLQIEAQVFAKSAERETILLLLVSPSAKDSATWKTLHEIGAKTAARITAP